MLLFLDLTFPSRTPPQQAGHRFTEGSVTYCDDIEFLTESNGEIGTCGWKGKRRTWLFSASDVFVLTVVQWRSGSRNRVRVSYLLGYLRCPNTTVRYLSGRLWIRCTVETPYQILVTVFRRSIIKYRK